jgi:hypothetical protein
LRPTASRRAGVTGINFDLIYGLPHQTAASCLDTVGRCVELRPDRFSVFFYAHVPTFKKHRRRGARGMNIEVGHSIRLPLSETQSCWLSDIESGDAPALCERFVA